MNASDHKEIKLHKGIILAIICMAAFIITVDRSVSGIALPSIAKNFKVNISSVQWIVTSYLVVISVLLPIWGRLSDLYGRKKVYVSGFIIFSIGSALCGLCSNFKILILCRIIQAIGASAIVALNQVILTRVFPIQQRGKALGLVGACVSVGNLAGSGLGGLLIHAIHWHTAFFISVPVGVIGGILALLVIPSMHDVTQHRPFDTRGTLLFCICILLIFTSLPLVQSSKMSPSYFTVILIFAIIGVLIFLVIEKTQSNPLISLHLFKIPPFSGGLSAAFLSFCSTSSVLLFMPFYFQNVLKLNAMQSGMVMSAYHIAAIIIAPMSGWLSDKFSYKFLTVAGLTGGSIVIFYISKLTAWSSQTWVAILMALLGTSISLFQSPNIKSIMSSVPKEELGIAGGLNALSRNLGLTAGTTLSVLIFSTSTNAQISKVLKVGSDASVLIFLKGFKIVIICSAIICFMGALAALARALIKFDEPSQN